MLSLKGKILQLVNHELYSAIDRHGAMRSAHEGYAVLLEEVDELWEEIKANDPEDAVKELIQVAAMAHRMLIDVYAAQVAHLFERRFELKGSL
jgi:hypothetical protein